MTKYKDIIINIYEEYIKLKIDKHGKVCMGRHKSRSKRSGKKS